jgi:hypothetical protein
MGKKRTVEGKERNGIIIGETTVCASRVRQLSPVLDVGTEDADVSTILEHVRSMVSGDIFLSTMAVLLCMVSLLPVQKVSNIHEVFTMLQFLCIPENVLFSAYRFSSDQLLPLYKTCLVRVMTKATIKKRFLGLVPEEIISWCKENPTVNLSDCPFHPQLYTYVRKHLDQVSSCTNVTQYMIEMSHEHVCEMLEKLIPNIISTLQEANTDPDAEVMIQAMGGALKQIPTFIRGVEELRKVNVKI